MDAPRRLLRVDRLFAEHGDCRGVVELVHHRPYENLWIDVGSRRRSASQALDPARKRGVARWREPTITQQARHKGVATMRGCARRAKLLSDSPVKKLGP